MKGINEIINIIKKDNSSEAKLLAYEVLAHMQERERYLSKGGVEEDSFMSKDDEDSIKEAKREIVEKRLVNFNEVKEEPEDLTEEISEIAQDIKLNKPEERKKVNLNEPPKFPKIDPKLMDKLLKKI